MTRDEVLELIREHLADELELDDPSRITEATHFRADLSAASLDLYTLVQELEDSYGVRMSDEQAARIHTVREAVDFVLAHDPAGSRALRKLHDLLERVPGDLARQAVTHSSWTDKRSDSYERLAFLGDSVLGLAITTHLYPRLQPDAFGAGRLTKVRAQAVSGRSCRDVAERLGIPEQLRNAAPPEFAGPATEQLARTERVLASVIEAVIGACYLEFGYEEVADAVVEAFTPEIERALAHPADFKSALQERLARRGTIVTYEVAAEEGPPHERTFEVVAMVEGEALARGAGRSKKDAEQAAAEAALESLGS